MQQKSTQKILLFSVAAQKWKNKSPVQNSWNIGATGGKSDYGQKLGAIAGITGFKRMVQGIAEPISRRSFWSFQVLIHHKWISFWRNIRRQVSNQSDVRLS